MADTNLNVNFKMGNKDTLPNTNTPGTLYVAKDSANKATLYLDDENNTRYKVIDDRTNIATYTTLEQLGLSVLELRKSPHNANFDTSINYILSSPVLANSAQGAIISLKLSDDTFHSLIMDKISKDLKLVLYNDMSFMTCTIEIPSRTIEWGNGSFATSTVQNQPLLIQIFSQETKQIYECLFYDGASTKFVQKFNSVQKTGDNMTGDLRLENNNRIRLSKSLNDDFWEIHPSASDSHLRFTYQTRDGHTGGVLQLPNHVNGVHTILTAYGGSAGNETTPVYFDTNGVALLCDPLYKVWTNASPSSTFAAQTINFAKRNTPKMCVVNFTTYAGAGPTNRYSFNAISIEPEQDIVAVAPYGYPKPNNTGGFANPHTLVSRSFSYTNNSITFGDAYSITATGTATSDCSTNNILMVPQAVYFVY